MEMLGMLLAGVGLLMIFVYGIILLIDAFKVSILWGLAYLLIPFASLVFVAMHWDVAKDAFIKSLIGAAIFAVGYLMLPSGAIQIH